MGLQFGGKYPCQATVWSIESKGNYTQAQISTSKKKQDGTYETDFSSYVRLVGAAHDKSVGLNPKDRITPTNFEITKSYNKEQKKEYTNIVIFDFDIVNQGENTKKSSDNSFMSIPDNIADDLPFK